MPSFSTVALYSELWSFGQFHVLVCDASLPNDFYLCLKCDVAVNISKKISIRKCKNTKAIYHNGYGYCERMPLVEMDNQLIDKFSFVKSSCERYKLSLTILLIILN